MVMVVMFAEEFYGEGLPTTKTDLQTTSVQHEYG